MTSEAGAADAGASDAGLADAGALEPPGFDCLKLVPPAAFCDDFEPAVSLRPHWDNIFVSPPPHAAIVRDTAAARTGTGSMLATLAPYVSPSSPFNAVWVTKAFRGVQHSSARYVVEFDFRIEQVDRLLDLQLKLFQFALGTGSKYSLLSLLMELTDEGEPDLSFLEEDVVVDDPTTREVESSPPARDHEWFLGPQINEWTHVTFVIEVDEPGGTENRASLRVGNAMLYDGPLYFALRVEQPSIDFGIPGVLGLITQVAPGTPWHVRYDNVLVQVEPR